jgi:hypothetical protein
MSVFALRLFVYSVLPVVAASVHIALDKSCRSRQRTLEIFLLYLFGVGVAAGGIGGFFGHFFISDVVAQSIGWPKGNPFQLEVVSRTWRSASWVSSPWAVATASAKRPSSPLAFWV